MIIEKKGCLAFAVCGSFCTLEDALGAAQALTAQGWTLLPVMSFAVQQDTRFGTGESWRQRLQAVTGHPVLDTLQAVEPLGPRRLAQALVVAPCTGATLARLAAGLSDTPVERFSIISMPQSEGEKGEVTFSLRPRRGRSLAPPFPPMGLQNVRKEV